MPRPKNPNRDPETDLKVFLGEELARARIAAGFVTQEALASHLGFDRSVISKTESGDRAPTNEVLRPAAPISLRHLCVTLYLIGLAVWPQVRNSAEIRR
jgi:transcriptional regulator with XRE-family HTH domain